MKHIPSIFAIAAALLLAAACSTAPFTGRKQFRMLPESELSAMALAQYKDFLSQNKVSTSKGLTSTVREIGVNIQRAAERYYTAKGLQDQLAGFQWEFNLVDDPGVNAWCMPGGKVVVYTGLLPIAQNTDGLAIVMGHEIAHALAHHGNERMSQGLMAQLGGVALDVATQSKPEETRQLFQLAYGVGAQLGAILPFSRKHESEADEIGLYLAAMAGYDVTEAAPFWQRMNQGAGGSPPEFLSTHPDPSKRSEMLNSLIPKAEEYRQQYGSGVKMPRKYF